MIFSRGRQHFVTLLLIHFNLRNRQKSITCMTSFYETEFTVYTTENKYALMNFEILKGFFMLQSISKMIQELFLDALKHKRNKGFKKRK